MKSSPAAQRSATSAAVPAGSSPTEGFTIVPTSGRPSTPDRRRVPSIPNPGPGLAAANSSGSRRSRSRSPENCLSSKRLPPTAAIRFGSDGPMFPTGQLSVTRPRRCGASGRPAPGSDGAATGPRSSSASTRAAERSFSSGVSPGSARNVPEDCSPAIASAASSSGQAVSIR